MPRDDRPEQARVQVPGRFAPNSRIVPAQHAAVVDASGWARGRRLSLAVLLGASGLMLGTAAHAPKAEAVCLPPAISVSPRSAPPGGTVVVTGQGWKHSCNDTVNCPSGGPCARDESAPPRTGIHLRFSQGRHSDSLGVVDAGQDSRFTYSVTVPRWAQRGSATIMADDVATGFAVAGAAPAADRMSLGGGDGELAAGPGAGSGGPPHPRTGMETGPLLALVLAAAAATTAATRRRLTP